MTHRHLIIFALLWPIAVVEGTAIAIHVYRTRNDVVWDLSKDHGIERVGWPSTRKGKDYIFQVPHGEHFHLTLILDGGKIISEDVDSFWCTRRGTNIDSVDISFPGQNFEPGCECSRELMTKWKFEQQWFKSLEQWKKFRDTRHGVYSFLAIENFESPSLSVRIKDWGFINGSKNVYVMCGVYFLPPYLLVPKTPSHL